jgi:hypothetical protein
LHFSLFYPPSAGPPGRSKATRHWPGRPGTWSPNLSAYPWSLGPSAVVLRIQGPWVYGALANNLWSVSSSHNDPSYNKFLLQPFINYNFAGGLYLTSAPIITADWKADSNATTI